MRNCVLSYYGFEPAAATRGLAFFQPLAGSAERCSAGSRGVAINNRSSNHNCNQKGSNTCSLLRASGIIIIVMATTPAASWEPEGSPIETAAESEKPPTTKSGGLKSRNNRDNKIDFSG